MYNPQFQHKLQQPEAYDWRGSTDTYTTTASPQAAEEVDSSLQIDPDVAPSVDQHKHADHKTDVGSAACDEQLMTTLREACEQNLKRCLPPAQWMHWNDFPLLKEKKISQEEVDQHRIFFRREFCAPLSCAVKKHKRHLETRNGGSSTSEDGEGAASTWASWASWVAYESTLGVAVVVLVMFIVLFCVMMCALDNSDGINDWLQGMGMNRTQIHRLQQEREWMSGYAGRERTKMV